MLSTNIYKNNIDSNVRFARQIANQMDRLADEVMNVDELEQQYRMTKDPQNPNNIFVLKFGKQEEQHWRLPWNPTTSLMCHMEPNKLLIEQSKYNAMYLKYSVCPHEFKKAQKKKKKQQILKSKEKAKKYKVKLASPIPDGPDTMNRSQTVHEKESRPPTTKFSEDFTANNKQLNAGLTAPQSKISQNNLMTPMKMDNKPRGTMLVNSMLVHTDKTVQQSSPTDQQLLIEKMQSEKKQQSQQQQLGTEALHLNAPSYNTLNTLNATENPMVTPITAQIRPELINMNKNRMKNTNDIQTDGIKPAIKTKRRVSLASVGDGDEWKDEEEEDFSDSEISEDDDDDDDEVRNDTKRTSKIGSIQLSVAISNHINDSQQKVQRLNSKNEYENFNDQQTENNDDIEYEEDIGVGVDGDEVAVPSGTQRLNTGKLSVQQDTTDITGFSPPRVTLESWMAADVWNGILYLGDEWDAFNYLEIMDNSIEYFINCAAGYCAFNYEQKLKRFWLENWRIKRDREKEERKQKTRADRDKRRRARLKKFQREHPNWKPKSGQPNLNDSGSYSNVATKMNGTSDLPDLNNVGLEEFTMIVGNQSPSTMKGATNSSSNGILLNNNNRGGGINKKEIRFGVPQNEDSKVELEYFQENREEFEIIRKLHEEILELEIDDSDHSSMYDSCISSDEYQYDSDEYDEYLGMDDDEIISKLCPFKFLNIYAHNWEGYRILDLHMNDVWNFIEECRMKNNRLKKEWKQNKEHMEDYDDEIRNKFDTKKPPKVSCLIFCTKNTIPMSRIESEIIGDPNYTLEQVGRSICTITDTYKQQQIIEEENVWNLQISQYNEYIEALQEIQQEKIQQSKLGLKNMPSVNYNMDPRDANEQKSAQPQNNYYYYQSSIRDIKNKVINKDKYNKSKQAERFSYKYWDLPVEQFWEDFDSLKTRNHAMNRIFASSSDRSTTLSLGFLIHSGIRLKQALKLLFMMKPNVLRNQSFLRQLIQLDWMKHTFEKPGMRKMIPYRDEYDNFEFDKYINFEKHYQIK